MNQKTFLSFVACTAGLLSGPAARAETRIIDHPGGGNNRIEVTGNRAENVQVRCADGRRFAAAGHSASVNSVHIDARALQGRTIIVTGRNTHDVAAQIDCADAQDGGPQVNVNSVNIR